MADLAAGIGDLKVLDPQGGPHRLADLWRDQTVVLVFVRHFG